MQNLAIELKTINDKLYTNVEDGNYKECIELLHSREPILKNITDKYSQFNTINIPASILSEISRMKTEDPVLMIKLELEMTSVGQEIAKNKIRTVEKHNSGYCINKQA
ncbi:MAG: hypothetical protein GY752_09505 [bacterium]|nr:hypothetical protein [bacterium]MCP4800719.1 hypothetical protein [bacterium]